MFAGNTTSAFYNKHGDINGTELKIVNVKHHAGTCRASSMREEKSWHRVRSHIHVSLDMFGLDQRLRNAQPPI